MQGYGGLRGPDYEDDALDRLLDEIPRATSAPPHLQERIALVSYVIEKPSSNHRCHITPFS